MEEFLKYCQQRFYKPHKEHTMAGTQTPTILCSPKLLPKERTDEALKLAVETNEANQPTEEAIAALQAKQATKLPRKELLAVLTSKYFGRAGVKLTVAFMEQTSQELKDRILSHMNYWSNFSNVKFVLTNSVGSAQVRISRSGSGYWSYLGTDVLLIPRNEPTMNLQGFSMSTSESEYKRVVRHETGHTLGFPHEHLREDIIKMLDRNKVIEWGRRVLGWSRQTVVEQILTPLDPSEIMGTPGADTRSIMTYQLPGEVTVSGEPILGGLDLSELDKQFVGKLYPKEDGPVEPPVENTGIQVFGTIAPGNYKLIVKGADKPQLAEDAPVGKLESLRPEGMSDIDWYELIRKAIELITLWLKIKDTPRESEKEPIQELDDEDLEDVNAGADKLGKLLPGQRARALAQANRPQGIPQDAQRDMGCTPGDAQAQAQRAGMGC